MKNILLLIFLPLLFLLGAKNMDDSFDKEKRMGVENVLLTDVPEGYVLSSVFELPDRGEACVDTESLRICHSMVALLRNLPRHLRSLREA